MNISLELPRNADILIKAGDEIDFDTPIITHQGTEEVKVPLAKLIKVPAANIFNHLKKFVGEHVVKGDLIAEHKSMFLKKQYYSEYDGIIKEVNHGEGAILMQTSSAEQTTTTSIIKGEVSSVEKKSIEVKVKNGKSFPLADASQSFGGKTLYCKPGHAQLLTETDVDGAIIITGSLLPYEHIKLETLGARGFVLKEALTDKTFLPVVILKDSFDMEKIFEHKLPYCTIDQNSNTIYFYN